MSIGNKIRPVDGKRLNGKEQASIIDLKPTDRRIMVCVKDKEPFGLRTVAGDAVVVFMTREMARANYDNDLNKSVIHFATWEQFAIAITDAKRIYDVWMGPIAVYEFVTAAQKIINERELLKQVSDASMPELGEQAGPVGTGE